MKNNEVVNQPEYSVDIQSAVDFFKSLIENSEKDEHGRVWISGSPEMAKNVGILAMSMISFDNIADKESKINKELYKNFPQKGKYNAKELCRVYAGLQDGFKLDLEIDEIDKYLANLKKIQETKGRIQYAIKEN